MNIHCARTLGLLAAGSMLLWADHAHAAIGFGATINVTTANDEFNNGAAGCSLREAVQTANTNADFGGCTHTGSFATGSNSDVVQLAALDYPLARNGIDEDLNSTSDLDILGNVTIRGAGAGVTSIFICAACQGRVIQVLTGTNVDIEDVTLKLGKLPSGRAGAGLRTEPGTSVTLTRVTVGQNTADGNAGGILNRGTMVLNDSVVDGNTTTNASQGGAGIFNDDNAILTLNASRVLNNSTTGNGANGSGAGIYSDVGAVLTLNDTTVDHNVIAIGGVLGTDVDGDGGGIFAAGQLSLLRSTVSNNVSAGNFSRGGGIYCDPSANKTVLIERSLVFANQALPNPDNDIDIPIPERAEGGGMFAEPFCSLTIRDSIFSGNSAQGGGGGLSTENANVVVERSLFVGNHADEGSGGGIRSSALSLALVNTTLLNNTATCSGGGLAAFEGGNGGTVVQISSSTIVGNTGDDGGPLMDNCDGGGIKSGGDFLVFMRNTVVAGNSANGAALGNDCFGKFNLRGNNLVQDTADCTLQDSFNTDKLGVTAQLAAATNNGGLVVGAANGQTAGMLTRAPLPASPLVDAGNTIGCEDQNDNALATDQLGHGRSLDGPDLDATARCDIGAIELDLAGGIFADSFE